VRRENMKHLRSRVNRRDNPLEATIRYFN